MQISCIGLGRMGASMVERLLEKQYDVHAFDTDPNARERTAERGAKVYESVRALIEALAAPRLVWIMVPRNGVEGVLAELTPLLYAGDTLIEGGNSYFLESIRRAAFYEEKNIHYLDVGVSGGVSGAREGACLMVGGKREQFEMYRSLFADLSANDGFGYMGPSGSGHFVKMIHNAIEYGMMGAIAEGMEAIHAKRNDLGIDLAEVIKVYGHGSIIESRLLNWLSLAWKDDPHLMQLPPVVPYGETEEEMEKLEALADVPVLKASRLSRVSTRDGSGALVGKVINALRFQFGGHNPHKK